MQAIQHYSKAIDLDPSIFVAYNNRAMAWLKLEEWQNALQDCDHVLFLEPTNVKALLRQANARCVDPLLLFLPYRRPLRSHIAA